MELTNSSIITVAGPTASGKSALAMVIAKAFNGEIVNFDSVQVYRGMNIGSAKTSFKQREGVRHHLIDVVDPSEDLTAGAYASLARDTISKISDYGKLPVLVGGTGFYLRSLLDGLSPAPPRNPDLRQRLTSLAARRPAALHRFLRRVNRAAAERIHANDHQKLIRAIELSAAPEPTPRQPLMGFRVIKFGLDPPRAELYDRINHRAIKMFESGLLEETKALLDLGIPSAAKAMQSLGYKQAVAVLENRISLPYAIAEVQTKTRQYAKRQMTWFRREKDMHWLHIFGEQVQIADLKTHLA